MPIQIFPPSMQGQNSFDRGKIEEYQPVLPDGTGGARAFSTLFYWAFAWSTPGGLIGTHPHRGFEILSYVLEGTIEHYDTLQDKWLQLDAGAVQIIRSGNGVSHAERFLPGTKIFQIWFDPNLNTALRKPASYDDYRRDDFPIRQMAGYKSQPFSAGDAGIKMDADAQLERIWFDTGTFRLDLPADRALAAFVIDGALELDDKKLSRGDFVKAWDHPILEFQAEKPGSLFLISLPLHPAYPTYAQQRIH